MKKKLITITALLLVFMLAFGTVAAYATNESDLKDVQNEIKDKKDELEQGKKEEKRLAQEIKNLEVKISEAENKLAELNKEISKTEKKIVKATEDLEKAEAEVAEQNENLNGRLRAMYKNGSVGFIDVLLSSGSVSEFIMNYEMVKEIYSSDKSILEELQANYDLIHEKKTELDNLQADLVGQKQNQLTLQEELKADKAAVAKKKGVVAANNEALEDNIADLKQEAANIEALIKKDAESSGGGGSGGAEYTEGQFSWPVPGWTRVSSNYGWRVCPFHGNEFHTGIDIPAGYGEAVVAAASGTVISACYQGSYGNAVLISHGGGLYTLYAHNSSLIVYPGQKVSKGQQIARIGSTGSSTGNHLHFEVRNGASYGSDVSPWGYLK